MSNFNMADVNVYERDSLTGTPTLKSARRSKGMQEKESIMVVWCGYKNPSLWITVRHHSAQTCDAKQ